MTSENTPLQEEYKLYRAEYDYEGQDENELSFKEGDIIKISKNEGDWFLGQKDSQKGWCPSNYLTLMDSNNKQVKKKSKGIFSSFSNDDEDEIKIKFKK